MLIFAHAIPLQNRPVFLQQYDPWCTIYKTPLPNQISIWIQDFQESSTIGALFIHVNQEMKESDRIQRRRELYAQNLRVFQELRSGGALPADLRPQNAALLDGSLKKNTAMVNKLKTITEENSGKLVDELKKLRFDKFLAEMVSSLTGDALGKLKAATGEIHGFLEVRAAHSL